MYLCICLCMFMYVQVHVCALMWRQEDNLGYHFLGLTAWLLPGDAKLARLAGRQVTGIWVSLLPSAGMREWTSSPGSFYAGVDVWTWVLILRRQALCWLKPSLLPVSPSSWLCGGGSWEFILSADPKTCCLLISVTVGFSSTNPVACQCDSALVGGGQSCYS